MLFSHTDCRILGGVVFSVWTRHFYSKIFKLKDMLLPQGKILMRLEDKRTWSARKRKL